MNEQKFERSKTEEGRMSVNVRIGRSQGSVRADVVMNSGARYIRVAVFHGDKPLRSIRISVRTALEALPQVLEFAREVALTPRASAPIQWREDPPVEPTERVLHVLRKGPFLGSRTALARTIGVRKAMGLKVIADLTASNRISVEGDYHHPIIRLMVAQ